MNEIAMEYKPKTSTNDFTDSQKLFLRVEKGLRIESVTAPVHPMGVL